MTPNPQHPNPQHDNGQHRADLIIDRTLNALRDAQPRAGVDAMNRRLLAALHAHEFATAHPATARASVWQRLHLLPVTSFALPMSAAVLIAVALLLPHLKSTLTSTSPTTEADTTYPTSNQPATQPTTQLQNRVPHAGVPSERASSLGWHISILRCMPATAACATTQPATPVTQATITPTLTVQTMLDDLHAPSQPTPPMPLTYDERILLRTASVGTETQLAFLEAPQRPSTHTPNNAIAQYIHHMLAPLAMAEALNPIPEPEPEAPPAATSTLDSAETSLQPLQASPPPQASPQLPASLQLPASPR